MRNASGDSLRTGMSPLPASLHALLSPCGCCVLCVVTSPMGRCVPRNTNLVDPPPVTDGEDAAEAYKVSEELQAFEDSFAVRQHGRCCLFDYRVWPRRCAGFPFVQFDLTCRADLRPYMELIDQGTLEATLLELARELGAGNARRFTVDVTSLLPFDDLHQ